MLGSARVTCAPPPKLERNHDISAGSRFLAKQSINKSQNIAVRILPSSSTTLHLSGPWHVVANNCLFSAHRYPDAPISTLPPASPISPSNGSSPAGAPPSTDPPLSCGASRAHASCKASRLSQEAVTVRQRMFCGRTGHDTHRCL